MKLRALVFPVLIIITLLIAGCGEEDDCPACPQQTIPRGVVSGSIYLTPQTHIDEIYIMGYGAVTPNIDSVRVGDSLLSAYEIEYTYDEDYHDAYWYIHFDEDGSNYMYSHGDTATVTIWGEGASSTCRLRILDADTAEASIISPAYNADTIASGESVTVHWHDVEDADYYAVLVSIRDYANGFSSWYNHFDYTTDSTFTVTPGMLTDSVYYFYFNVTPFTGPDPRTGLSNWSGSWLTGKLYSFGWDDYTLVYGWSHPPQKAAGEVINEPERKPWTPTEIIDEVYKRAR